MQIGIGCKCDTCGLSLRGLRSLRRKCPQCGDTMMDGTGWVILSLIIVLAPFAIVMEWAENSYRWVFYKGPAEKAHVRISSKHGTTCLDCGEPWGGANHACSERLAKGGGNDAR